MKTPMQELIEVLKIHRDTAIEKAKMCEANAKSYYEGRAKAFEDAISFAELQLEKEKEFALNLWGQYEKECIIYNDYLGDHAYSIDAIEWYDQTFNTNEK